MRSTNNENNNQRGSVGLAHNLDASEKRPAGGNGGRLGRPSGAPLPQQPVDHCRLSCSISALLIMITSILALNSMCQHAR